MEVDGNDDHIVSIIEACRCLGADKIIERRKNAETINTLLHNTNYVTIIDENSDNATGFTWNDVFKAACNFMKKEVEKYKADEAKSEAKSGVTQAQRKTRDYQLEVSSNFVMNIINMASCRKPRLDVDLVMEHCLKNMTDSFNRDKFGRDHLNSLNNDTLSKRSYWSKLKPNLWLSLFLISVKLLRSPTLPPGITYVSLSTLLNYVVHHGTLQSDIFLSMKKKITFFIDTMNNKTMLVKEHHLVRIWLDTAIQLALTFGSEDRSLLCTLTEKTLNTFLDLCHDHLEEMDLLVQYSILAIVAHHPNSVESGEPGFLVTGCIEDWQKIVRRLHSLTDFQIKILHQRCSSGRSKSYELEPNQVTMAVIVARQIFSSSFDLAEVTRMGVLDETGTLTSTGPSVAKKKRLMSGLSELIERLRQLGPVSESIPFLQIATKFVSDYPTFPQHYEMKELLNYVIEVTHDCRQYDMMSHCFRLFRIVYIAHSANTSDIVQPEGAVKLWDSVWKCLAAHECTSESFLLLATLLNYRLVPATSSRQLIQLLARPGGNSVPCDSSSVVCLAAFIQQYPLPENLSSGLLEDERSVRSILSQWLLDCSDDSSGTDLHFRLFYSLARKLKPSLGEMDLSLQLKQLGTQTSFDTRCRNLESMFSYIQLLEDFDEPDTESLSPSFLDVTWPGLMSIGLIGEQQSLMVNRCIKMTIELENHRNINSEVLSEIQHAVRFLSIVRNFVTLQKMECTKQLRKVATLLLKAVLDLIFKEESAYSRHCVRMLTSLFQDETYLKRDDKSEDFLRQFAWLPTFRKVESLLSTGPNNGILDQVRQSTEDEEAEEGSSKATSIFDSSVLETQSEQAQVGLFRLLGVISCPLSWENDKPEYRSMKMDLLCLLASISDQKSVHYLQMSFFLLRPYSAAQSHSLDANLVTDLVDLTCRLGRLFIHDHEVASAILDVLPRLAAHVIHCSTSKSKLLTLINSYRSGVQEDAFGPPVEAAYHRCIARLDCQWVWTDDGTEVALDLLEGFNRPLNSTVICTSRLIRHLFNADNWSSYLQDSTLAALTNSIMNIQGEGEHLIRSAVILQTLSSIVVKSPWTEKNAILMMLRFASEQHELGDRNMLGLLRLALELAARRLNVDCSMWMDSRLEYILDRWLPQGKLEKFPHSVYHCTTQEQFLHKYANIVAPVVFLKFENQEEWQRAAEMAGFLSAAEWFREHLPAIVGKILPPLIEFLLAQQQQQNIVSASSINRFGQLKLQSIHQLFDKVEIRRSLQKGLHDLLVRLLSSIDDPALTLRLFGNATCQLTITSTFRYPKTAILEAARHYSPEFIAQDDDIANSQRPYHYLLLYLTSQPWSAHGLLVDLYSSYESGCRSSDRLHSLVAISVASEILVSALLSDQDLNNILNYVFHSLISWLGHLLRNEKTSDIVQHSALVIFGDLVKTVRPVRPEIVAKQLVNIVSYITPLAATRPLAMSLLDFLLMDHEAQLKSVLNQLCPFPDTPQFAHLIEVLDRNHEKSDNGELVDEIDNFLRLASQVEQFANVPIESVNHLIKILIQHKEELVKMYAELEDSDKQRRLHSLTCCLIRLAMNTKLSNPMIQAIATALGELGPGDLKSLVLHQSNYQSDMKTPRSEMENYARNTDSTVQFGLAIIPSLVRFLFAAENVKLLLESGPALLATLKTFEGQEFYAVAQQFEWPSFDLLSLFKPTKKQDNLVKIIHLSVDPEHFRNCVHDDTMWIPSPGHSSWLTRLTSTLIGTFSTGLFSSLLPVCRLEPELCSNLLPHLIETLLKFENSDKLEARKVISQHMNKALLAQPSTNKESWIASLKTLLNIVQHLRLVKSKKSSKKVANEKNNFWNVNFQLDLNYLSAAKAAHSCSAYFTTIMYAEIWLDILNTSNDHPIASSDGNNGGFVNTTEPFNAVQELLFEAYASTGEPDGRTGFQSLLSSSPAWEIRRHEQKSQWFQALECHDALAQQDHSAILNALSRCGLYRTAADLASSPGYNHSASPAVREFQYECSWRLGQWNLQESEETDKPGLNQLVCRSLLALKNNDQFELDNRISDSRLLIIDDLRRSGSLESCHSIYPALTSLRLINDIQDFARCQDNIASLRSKWQQNDSMSVADFKFSEPSLALRSVVIKERISPSDNLLGQTLLQTCRLARQCGNYPVAGRYLIQMESFLEVPEFNAPVRLEKALTEWQRGDVDKAVGTLRSLVISLRSKSMTSMLYSHTLCLLGQWLHETRAENPRQILDLYLKKSLTAAENNEASTKWSSNNMEEYTSKSWSVSEARQVLASYADSLYKDLQLYMESREFETQRKLTQIRQGKVSELKRINQSLPKESKVGTEYSRAHIFMHGETNNDESEFKELFLERNNFLLLAVQNYLIGMHQDTSSSHLAGAFDVRVSRLISLWFDRGNRKNRALTDLLVKYLPSIPSHHWIPVLPQLAARLVVKSNDQLYVDDFPKLLSQLINRCLIDHPYHTLPVIMALSNNNKDKELEGFKVTAANEEERVTAAKSLIKNLTRRKEVGGHCLKLDQLSNELIKLANKDVKMYKKDKNDKHADPLDLKKWESENLKTPPELVKTRGGWEDVAVPTVTMPVRPDSDYSRDFVGIVSFSDKFELVGGINAPKKLTCRGTDGKTRPMLLKGKDDLRQDAVMQQVFGTMNTFLQQDESTRQRHLRIRTYKVVPLSRRSGLLEWCVNTMPIGNYLLGPTSKDGAHLHYARPEDLTTRETLDHVQKLEKILCLTDRTTTFLEICAHFPPVFRHFFLERYTSPSLWFEKRLNYTRSVAASSMVGYILGLGDRHLSNILIDETTAELIHIDFGIAFEQGRVLPVPELVPFRLTRDIIDPMGPLGVEGIFRRCCEFTMSVMRQQQESILTLLEVLLYDPLYVWAVTPKKAAAVQEKQRNKRRSAQPAVPEVADESDNGQDSQGNESAKRTLVRLGQKLKGVEKGTPLSVAGQVNLLIQQARDPAHLCTIFHGWKPQA